MSTRNATFRLISTVSVDSQAKYAGIQAEGQMYTLSHIRIHFVRKTHNIMANKPHLGTRQTNDVVTCQSVSQGVVFRKSQQPRDLDGVMLRPTASCSALRYAMGFIHSTSLSPSPLNKQDALLDICITILTAFLFRNIITISYRISC